MPKQDLVSLLRRSVSEWNEWRARTEQELLNMFTSSQPLEFHDEEKLHEIEELIKLDLTDVNLEGATLRGANLGASRALVLLISERVDDIEYQEGLISSMAVFNNANFRNADLRGCILHRAYLKHTNLQDADMSGADLSDSRLDAAEINGANFNCTNLSRASLCNAKSILWHPSFAIIKQELKAGFTKKAPFIGANLYGTNLSGAILSGLNLRGVNFSNTILKNANLVKADLREAKLIEADLWEANLWEADLESAVLTRSNLRSADLQRANLNKADLTDVHLEGADLREANLCDAVLQGVDFSRMDLSGTNLVKADLRNTNLSAINLTKKDLQHAKLHGADLSYAVLVNTNFKDADLDGCRVYGAAVWDVNLEGTSQRDLVITPGEQQTVTVDDLELAQFIYLLLRNEEVRKIIDTITSKVVLILGRFTEERKNILDALRNELRTRDYTPVLFDFDKPASRDLTETVSTLAHMAKFVIADITDARSIPQELQKIIPNLPSVPVRPIILENQFEFAMFKDFGGFLSVLPPYRYRDTDDLLKSLESQVIGPALTRAKVIEEQRIAFEQELAKR